MWKAGRILADLVPVLPEVEDNPPEDRGGDSEDSQEPEPASSPKVAKTVDRSAGLVELQFFGCIELVPMVAGWGERGSSRALEISPKCRIERSTHMSAVSVGRMAGLIAMIILVMPLQRGLETNPRCKIFRETQNGLRRNPSLGAGQATMIAGHRLAPDRDGAKRD